MLRQTLRSTPRAAGALRQSALRSSSPRFASTKPADQPRSWKGSAMRWGLAFGAVYYYNTSPIFADEPAPRTMPEPPHFSASDDKTVDAVIEEKRQLAASKNKTPAQPQQPSSQQEKKTDAPEQAQTGATAAAEPGSPEALEEEAGQQGAFNPETGEINWDCPCLGGMADGPCGEEFKTAFSCFVFSEEEPKGMDCIEKFQGMQECFRKYPEVYATELQDDEEDSAAESDAPPAMSADADATPAPEASELKKEDKKNPPMEKKPAEAAPAAAPKKIYDATDANIESTDDKGASKAA